MVRWLVCAAALALVGCGGGGEESQPPAKAPSHRSGNAVSPPKKQAPEAIWMYRVLGDDPLPDTITVRRDGSVEVIRGGGHGGSHYNDVVLSRHEQRKVLRLARRAPLQILAHNTIEPGGFGGWDNSMRYLIRRDHKTVGVQQGDIPKPIRPLVRELDRIIENYVGRIVHSRMQSGVGLG